MDDLGVPNAQRSIAVLEQTPVLLKNLLAPLAPEHFTWRPNEARWSIAMVLAHLADVEVSGFRNRFQAMLTEVQPFLPGYDQLALFRSRSDFDATTEMRRFEEERGNTLALLKALPDAAGARSGKHEDFGLITVAQLLNEFAFHDLGHIRQTMELYRSRVFYPEMGPYQDYYKINP